MILTGSEIIRRYNTGEIHISPFNESFINPNSIDVSLYPEIIEVRYDGDYIDLRDLSSLKKRSIVHDLRKAPLVIKPGILYLGCTNEEVGSRNYVPMYDGRSSTARIGLASHITAGFGDLGFERQWTLEIVTVYPIRIPSVEEEPIFRIGQVYFERPEGSKEMQYTSAFGAQYSKQSGPTFAERIFK